MCPSTFVSKCDSKEFGCNNGQCFPISVRCNEKKDCKDHSDESNCTLVKINDDLYHKEYPAISREEGFLSKGVLTHPTQTFIFHIALRFFEVLMLNSQFIVISMLSFLHTWLHTLRFFEVLMLNSLFIVISMLSSLHTWFCVIRNMGTCATLPSQNSPYIVLGTHYLSKWAAALVLVYFETCVRNRALKSITTLNVSTSKTQCNESKRDVATCPLSLHQHLHSLHRQGWRDGTYLFCQDSHSAKMVWQ